MITFLLVGDRVQSIYSVILVFCGFKKVEIDFELGSYKRFYYIRCDQGSVFEIGFLAT